MTFVGRAQLAGKSVTLILALAGAIVALPVSAANPGWSSAAQASRQSADQHTDLKPFLGTWKASFQGEEFAVLVLTEDRGSIAGTMNNFDITYDKGGNLAPGTHKDHGDAPLLNVHLRSGALYFVVLQKDQYFPATEWKFVPKDANEGELTQMIDNQTYTAGDITARPIRMVRDSSKP